MLTGESAARYQLIANAKKDLSSMNTWIIEEIADEYLKSTFEFDTTAFYLNANDTIKSSAEKWLDNW